MDPIPVVCAIIEKNEKFLAAKRASGQFNSGLWEFPGGKVEKSEAYEDALRRELREELDIKINIHSGLSSVVYHYPGKSIELIPFICSLCGKEPVPLEHEEIRFISREESSELNWTAADIPVLEEYLGYRRPIALL